jgi:hypothetical protein
MCPLRPGRIKNLAADFSGETVKQERQKKKKLLKAKDEREGAL